MDTTHKTYKTEDRQIKALSFARLIQRFEEGCSLDEVYEKACRSYDILINVLEDADTARNISALVHMHIHKVQAISQEIFDLLLFNRENNPYLSFGFQKYAPLSDIEKTWRRLLLLYHPDKHIYKKSYEKKAQKINEAFEKIKNMNKRYSYNKELKDKSVFYTSPRSTAVYHSKYFKNIPRYIIAFAVTLAIISIFLFFLDI
jgi:hypothetical protein